MRRYIPGACLLVAATPKPPDKAASGVCLYQQGNERRYTVWASPASVPPLSPPCAVSITTNEPPLCCIRRFFSKPPFTTFVLAQRSADFASDAVKSLASYLLGGENKVFHDCRERDDVYSIDLHFTQFPEELAIFDSVEAAAKVLDDICRALDSGKQYFDLTRYGNNGNLL